MKLPKKPNDFSLRCSQNNHTKSPEPRNGQQTSGSRHLQQRQDRWYHPPSWPLPMNLAARSEKLRQYKPNGSTPLISKSVSEHRRLHPPSDITAPSFNTHLSAILLQRSSKWMTSKMLYVYEFFGSPSKKHDQTITASCNSPSFVSRINPKDQFLDSLQAQALVWVPFRETIMYFIFLFHKRPRFTFSDNDSLPTLFTV
jgi:hypothetical protein